MVNQPRKVRVDRNESEVRRELRRTQVLLDEGEWQAVRIKAFREERSCSSVVREAIRLLLERDRK